MGRHEKEIWVNPDLEAFDKKTREIKKLEQQGLSIVEDYLENSDIREEMLQELGSLTSKMDVPDYRRQDYRWLAKHLPDRNSTKQGFGRAMGIVAELVRMG